MSTRIILLAIVTVAQVTLASCGGGGSQSAQTQTDLALNDTTQLAAVTVDATLTPIVSTRITEIVSVVDAKPLGAPIRIPSQSGGDTSFIAATDAQGRILLAAYSKEASVKLSADSTAYALARMILGAPPLSATEATWESKIRALPPFLALVFQIDASIRSGNAPDEDSQVATALLSLLQMANADAKITASAPPQVARVRALGVKSPSVDALPFTAVSESYAGATFSVRVTEGLSDGSIEVTNSTPLYWAMSSELQNAQKIAIVTVDGKPRVVAGAAIVDGVGYGQAILEGVDNWLIGSLISSLGAGGQKVVLPGAPSEGFNLVVEQNDEAFSLNLVKVADGIVGQFLNMLPKSAKCEKSFLKSVLPDDKLLLLSRDRSVDSFKSYLKSNSTDWAKAIKDCALASEAKLVGRYVSIYWSRFNALLVAMDSVDKAEKGLTVLARLNMLEKYKSSKFALGVCQAKKSLLGVDIGFKIASCAKTLSIEPLMDVASKAPIQAPSMIPLASLKLKITARDSNDQPTLIPSSLKITSSDPSSVTIESSQDGEVVVRASKIGQSYIVAKDMATGVESFMPFSVVSPSITALKLSLNVGDETQIRLTDSLGQTVFSDGARVSWSSSNDQKIALSPFGNQSAPYVRGLDVSADRISISARNEDTGTAMGQIFLEINGGGYWKGTHEIVTCTPKQPDSAGSPDYYWENPCDALGAAYGRKGYFYFDNIASTALFGYEYNTKFESLREVIPVALRSDMTGFTISTPLERYAYAFSRIEVVNNGFVNKLISSKGTRIANYVVNASTRTATSISGTFTITTRSGYFVTPGARYEDWKEVDTIAAGIWSAQLINGTVPKPVFNGYKYCFFNNSALFAVPTYPNVPISTPGWNQSQDSGCSFN